jgi:predicted transposase/invertase (TIGR01784 family)
VSQTPHDALFRFTFGKPENAAALIRSNLPDAIARRIDWRSLRLQNGSHVDPASQWRHSDLVFTANIDRRRTFIYVLLEHRSSPDPLMPLRMLGYVVRLWEDVFRKNPKAKRMPAVLPLVVYHGDSPWSGPTRMLDIIDLDGDSKAALAAHLPNLELILDDLTSRGEQHIRRRRLPVAAMLTALSLLGFPKRDALTVLSKLVDLLRQLPMDRAGQETLAAVLCYVFEVADSEPEPLRLQSFLARNVGSRATEVVMSTAEKLRQQGRAEGEAAGLAKGEAAGLAKGRVETLLKQLTLKFGQLTATTRKRVESASIDELDRLAERILSAQTLREIFADKPATSAVTKTRRKR